ncbi:MAG: ABC transporter ATP-binding protein [Desulfobacteraceae bacterium]|nr:MAG: ABC transporter ATP-binding protein [Desulfobacteraceae bacterium]
MTAIVEARNLQKSYGKIRAVEDVSFSIEEGEIFGLLGPNGAGKTTTIRMLSSLTDPDGGEALVDGRNVVEDPVGAKMRLGVVPESSNLYMELTARENLIYMAQLYGMPKSQWEARAEELLRQFGLHERKDSRFQGFSRGMKRRLTIAAALVHRPRIVFLDEPTTALDIMSARGLRKSIRELKKSGVTVLLTTHLIPEAEELCDRVAIILKGKILMIDTVAGIRQQVKETEILELALDPFSEPIVDRLKGIGGIEKVSKTNSHLRLYGRNVLREIPAIVQALSENRTEILSIHSLNPSLEDAFVKLTGVEAEVMKIDKPLKPAGGGA